MKGSPAVLGYNSLRLLVSEIDGQPRLQEHLISAFSDALEGHFDCCNVSLEKARRYGGLGPHLYEEFVALLRTVAPDAVQRGLLKLGQH